MKISKHLWPLLLLVLVSLVGCYTSSKVKKDKSNILWIMTDDHTANTISAYKIRFSEILSTPNIDRLTNGGGHTGWSRAWIINFWARLLEPQKAHENIIALQRKSTISNLLDVCPPFQIDGNFGVVSGVTEMLMQSHDNEIFILPALPVEWSKASINGLLARKGFEVDLEWENSILKSVTIESKLGNNLQLRYGDIVVNKTTQVGGVLKFNSKLEAI
jgi:alpha-L-fucosidase 2